MEYGALDLGLSLLGLAVLAVAALRRLHLPPILGYLLVGALAGPHAFGWLPEAPLIRVLGEIGIAFLLFSIGLEFSLPRFWAMRRALLGLGGTQVLAGTVSGGLIAWAIGIPPAAALVVGGALAMSSTAIVVKQLTDQLELGAPHGRLALGVLLFQDLAAVPFLVAIPILAQGNGALATALGWALAKGVAAGIALLAVGRYLLRPLFHEVARSAELFTLGVLLVSLAAAWVTSALGLSLALGTFLAGMMLAESEYRHPIETDIRPFRDVLLGLFFVNVGMQLEPAALLPNLGWIALLTVGLVVGKGLVVAGLARLGGYAMADALRAGIVLGQGGEFGFALLVLALGRGLLDPGDSQPVLAAVLLSMLLAPLAVRYNEVLARRLSPTPPAPAEEGLAQGIAEAVADTRGHVILCGYGRVGQALAGVLSEEGLPFIALDLDPQRVRQAWEDGEPVYYGDASHPRILAASGLERARVLVVTFDDARATLKILHAARQLRQDLPILVRARDNAQLERLLAAGATEVVPETLEASLTLAAQLLLLLDQDPAQVGQRLARVRADRYRLLEPLYGEGAGQRRSV